MDNKSSLKLAMCNNLFSVQLNYTDKKENQTFLIYRHTVYKDIQKGSVAKSYTVWLTASSYMVKYFCISSYIRTPFLIYDFATAPFWISLYMRKISFSFLSVYCPCDPILTYLWRWTSCRGWFEAVGTSYSSPLPRQCDPGRSGHRI